MIKNLHELTNINIMYDKFNFVHESELQSISENINQIKCYLDNYNIDKDFDINSIIDYFIIIKIIKWNPESRDVAQYKDVYNEIVGYCKNKLKNFPQHKIIKFFSEFSYKDLDYYTKRMIYDYLPTLSEQLVNTEAYKKAILENPLFVLHRYKIYKKVFAKDKSLYDLLFTETNIKMFLEVSNLKIFVEVAIDINNDKSLDDELKHKLISALSELGKRVIDESNYENPLILHQEYNIILDFFKKIKNPEYNVLLKHQRYVESQSNNYLSQKNNRIEIFDDINVEPIIKSINNPNIPLSEKVLKITHYKSETGLRHFCTIAKDAQKESLLEYITVVNMRANEHFGYSGQLALERCHKIIGLTIVHLVNTRENYYNFCNCIYDLLSKIYDKIALDISTLNTEFNSWQNKGYSFFFDKNCEKKERQSTLHDYSLSTLNLTEKILRLIYCAEQDRNKEFYDPDNVVLVEILDYKRQNNYLRNVFSDDELQYLQYCLIKESDNKNKGVGLKLRNDYGHNNDDWDEIPVDDVYISLSCFLSIVNRANMHYSKN